MRACANYCGDVSDFVRISLLGWLSSSVQAICPTPITRYYNSKTLQVEFLQSYLPYAACRLRATPKLLPTLLLFSSEDRAHSAAPAICKRSHTSIIHICSKGWDGPRVKGRLQSLEGVSSVNMGCDGGPEGCS